MGFLIEGKINKFYTLHIYIATIFTNYLTHAIHGTNPPKRQIHRTGIPNILISGLFPPSLVHFFLPQYAKT